jgi:hypothetical protein
VVHLILKNLLTFPLNSEILLIVMNDTNKFDRFDKFVNLTPHDVTVVSGGKVKKYLRDGTVARVTETTTLAFSIDEVDINDVVFGDIIGLPAPVKGVWFIVSAMVKEAVKKSGSGRNDCVSPGNLIRNEKGEVIGCKGFAR